VLFFEPSCPRFAGRERGNGQVRLGGNGFPFLAPRNPAEVYRVRRLLPSPVLVSIPRNCT
jgi:hypothetical protein